MIIFITERQICYQLHRKQWFCCGNKKSYLDDWRNWNKGVSENEFENYLFSQEFGGSGLKYVFISVYVKLRPRFLKTFRSKVRETINYSVEAGYIQKKTFADSNRLVLTREGKKFISLFYFPTKILEIFGFLSKLRDNLSLCLLLTPLFI